MTAPPWPEGDSRLLDLRRLALLGSLLGTLALLAAACSSSSPTTTPTAPRATTELAGVPGIIDAGNLGWPREVEGLNGRVTIPAKPERIVTLSVGHDEVTYALVPAGRVVGVGSSTQNPMFSNVADLAAGAETIGREPEVILSVSPDVMVTSPFVSSDVVQALSGTGLPVVQTRLANDIDARIQAILLMGYIYGEEERAIAFAREVRERWDALQSVVGAKPVAERQRVMSSARFSDKIFTAGGSSTEGGIIEAAGGINVAAEAGLTGNPTISIESIVAMRPDVILVPQPADSGQDYIDDLLGNAALADVPAIRDRQVFLVDNTSFTTLSHWNLVGAEKLARMLWPSDFEDEEIRPFSFPR